MSPWTVEITSEFEKAIKKLDRATAKRIITGLENIVASGDPRSRGTGLSGNRSGCWRYRFGDYRVIAIIEDRRCTIVAVAAGHRSTIYT